MHAMKLALKEYREQNELDKQSLVWTISITEGILRYNRNNNHNSRNKRDYSAYNTQRNEANDVYLRIYYYTRMK